MRQLALLCRGLHCQARVPRARVSDGLSLRVYLHKYVLILRQNGPIAAVEADGRPLCHFLVRNLQHRIPTILRRSPDRFFPCSKRHNYQGCLSWSSLHPQLAWKPGGRSVILGFVCLRGVFDLDKAGEYDIIPVAIGLECANFCLGQFESARTDQEL